MYAIVRMHKIVSSKDGEKYKSSSLPKFTLLRFILKLYSSDGN